MERHAQKGPVENFRSIFLGVPEKIPARIFRYYVASTTGSGVLCGLVPAQGRIWFRRLSSRYIIYPERRPVGLRVSLVQSVRVSNTWAAGPVRASSRAYTDLHGGQLYAYMRMV